VQTITVNGQTSSMQRYVAENVNQVVDLVLDDGAQNQSMWGGRGGDSLTSSGSATTVAGGLGDDRIEVTGAGNEIIFNQGDGADTVTVDPYFDPKDIHNTLVLGDGIERADVLLSLNAAGALVVSFAGLATDCITVRRSNGSQSLGVTKLRLADGSDNSSGTSVVSDASVQSSARDSVQVVAMHLVAAHTSSAGTTGRFDEKNTCQRVKKQHFQCRLWRSNSQSARAYSMRLAGHKWLERRVDRVSGNHTQHTRPNPCVITG